MKRFKFVFFFIFLAFTSSSCVSWGGSGQVGFASKTELQKGNYQLIESIKTKVSASYILGLFATEEAKVNLYQRAFQELRQKAKMKGKPRALKGVVVDVVVKNSFLFSEVEMTVSADVIEFK